MFIHLDAPYHLVIDSKIFKNGFFCFGCSLFNPKILYYEIQERLKEWRESTKQK